MWRLINRFYPAWLELLVFGLLFFSGYYALASYPHLPQRVPTHFGLDGRPDAWQEKTVLNVFNVWLLQFLLYLVFTGLSYWILTRRDPRRLVRFSLNWTEKQKASFSLEELEAFRAFNLRWLIAFRIMIMGLQSYINVASINVALSHWRGLGWLLVLGGLIVFVLSFWVTLQTANFFSNLRKKRPVNHQN